MDPDYQKRVLADLLKAVKSAKGLKLSEQDVESAKLETNEAGSYLELSLETVVVRVDVSVVGIIDAS